jgi:penicillin-binding protein 1A
MAASIVGGGLPARLWKGFMAQALQMEGKMQAVQEIAPVEVDMDALATDLEGMTIDLNGEPNNPPPVADVPDESVTEPPVPVEPR